MKRTPGFILGLAATLMLGQTVLAQTTAPAATAAPGETSGQKADQSKDPYKDNPVLPGGGLDVIPPEKPQQAAWPFTQRGLDFEPIYSLRKELEDNGISLRFRWVGFIQNLSSGGVKTAGATDFSEKYNVDLALDLQKLTKFWKGGRILLAMEGVTGQGLTRDGYVGDVFGVDRVAGSPDGVYLKKYFFEQTLKFDDLVKSLKLRFMIGKMDVRDEFDKNAYTYDYRLQFLNRSFVNNPTFSFQDGTLGIVLSLEHELGYIRSGVYDAAGNDRTTGFTTAFDGDVKALSVTEVGFTPKFDSPNGKLPGNYRVGIWYNGSSYNTIDYNNYKKALPPNYESGNNGVYVSCDQMVWKEEADPKDKQGIGLFFKYGTAQQHISKVTNFYSFGANWTGPIPTRDDDVFAAGFNVGDITGKYNQNRGSEAVFETYYDIAVFPWLVVGPDFQYIINTGGGSPAADDAVLVGFRIYMNF